MKYKVVESLHWVSNDGATASVYGAVPYHSEAEKQARGWRIESRGWTLKNPHTGEVGICSPPFATYEEAQTIADKIKPSRIGIGY